MAEAQRGENLQHMTMILGDIPEELANLCKELTDDEKVFLDTDMRLTVQKYRVISATQKIAILKHQVQDALTKNSSSFLDDMRLTIQNHRLMFETRKMNDLEQQVEDALLKHKNKKRKL